MSLEAKIRGILSNHFGGGQWESFRYRFTPAAKAICQALAAAAREGGDVEQAPGETPQSGAESATPNPLSPSRGNEE